MTRASVPWGFVAAVVVMAPSSRAVADGFDGQRYRPAAGAAGGFSVERPLVPLHLGFGAGLFLHFADDAVVDRDQTTGAVAGRLLDQALTLDVLASLGLFDFLEVAVGLPVHLVYDGDPAASGGQTFAASSGVGDLRIMPKAVWEWGQRSLYYALGVAVPLSLPTGNDTALRGAGHPTGEPRLLAGLGGERWGLIANLGLKLRSDTTVGGVTLGNELAWGLAALYAIPMGKAALELEADLVGGWVLPDQRAGHTEAPLELLGGVIFHPDSRWSLYGGGGLGLTNGLGTPDFRLIAGVRFAVGVPGDERFQDSDSDGIRDSRDRCPREPEDYDGFQDDDGCPETDNDLDGVPDETDECPDYAADPGSPGNGCPRGRVTIRKGEVHVFGKVQFPTGSADVSPESQHILDEIAAGLKAHPEVNRVRIDGHTDDQGDAGLNHKLSEQRAETVKRELVKRGIPESRLSTRGFGEEQPLAPNQTAAGRAKNRRVEFIIED